MPYVALEEIQFDDPIKQEAFPSHDDQSPYDDLIGRTSEQYQVDPTYIRAMVKTESDFKPKAVSVTGMGLMNVHPKVVKNLGIQPGDPIQNMMAGVQEYKAMLDKFKGDNDKAAAAYILGGPGKIQSAQNIYKDKWLENLSEEDRAKVEPFINKVNKFHAEFKKPKAVSNFVDMDKIQFDDDIKGDYDITSALDVGGADPEIAFGLAGTMAAMPVAGLGGLAELLYGGTEDIPGLPGGVEKEDFDVLKSASNVIENMASLPMKALSHQTQKDIETLFTPMIWIDEKCTVAADYYQEKFGLSDNTAAAIKTIGQYAAYFGMPFLAKSFLGKLTKISAEMESGLSVMEGEVLITEAIDGAYRTPELTAKIKQLDDIIGVSKQKKVVGEAAEKIGELSPTQKEALKASNELRAKAGLEPIDETQVLKTKEKQKAKIEKAEIKEVEKVKIDEPVLISSSPRGSQLYLEFDNRAGTPTNVAQIKKYAKDLGYDIEIVKFQENIISKTRDTNRFRIDVFEDGKLSTKAAEKLSKEFGGDFSTLSELAKKRLEVREVTKKPKKELPLFEEVKTPKTIEDIPVGEGVGERRAAKRDTGDRRDFKLRKATKEMSKAEITKKFLTDEMTGLANKEAFERAPVQKKIGSIDLDKMKRINDTYGLKAGDAYLKHAAEGFKQSDGLIYRYGGDDFFIKGNTTAEINANMVKVNKWFKENPIVIEGETIHVGATYGVGEGRTSAFKAMKEAKEVGVETGKIEPRYEVAGEVAKKGEGPQAAETVEPADYQTYIDELGKSKYKHVLTIPESVEALAADVKKGSRVFLTKDKKGGFIIDAEGDLQKVFNNSGKKGLGRDLVNEAIEQGATKLDAFDEGFLKEYYEGFGFRETSRAKFDRKYAPKDFPKDKSPDVVFMELEKPMPSKFKDLVQPAIDKLRDIRSVAADLDLIMGERGSFSTRLKGSPLVEKALKRLKSDFDLLMKESIKADKPIKEFLKDKGFDQSLLDIFTEDQFKRERVLPVSTSTEITKRMIAAIKDPTKEFRTVEGQRIMFDMETYILEHPKEFAEILKRENITPEQVAIAVKESLSYSGKTLNRASQVAKQLEKKFPGFSDKGLFKDLPPSSAWNDITNIWMRVDRVRRTVMVSQLATAMRNIISQKGYYTLNVLEDAVAGALKTASFQESPKNAFMNFGQDIAAMYRRMTGKQKARMNTLFDLYPELEAELLGSPVHDIPIEGKATKFLMFFNRMQENFFRKTIFDSKFTTELNKMGLELDSLKDLTGNQKYSVHRALERSLDTALEMTFAKTPNVRLGKLTGGQLLHYWNRIPGLTTIQPYPRFWANAMKFVWDYNPTGAITAAHRLAKGKGAAAVTQALAKSMVGTAMLGMAMEIRKSKYAGENYYELHTDKIDKKTGKREYVDLRAFAPFTFYLFAAEALLHPERITPSDYAEGLLGMNRIAGTSLVLVDVLRAKSGESAAVKAKHFAAQYLSGFTVGARMIKDIMARWKPKNAEVHDTKDTWLGPAMENLPLIVSETMLKYKMPLAERLTRPGGYTRKAPLQRQLTGLTRKDKTIVEREIDRLNLKSLYPKTGDGDLNRKLLAGMNAYVDKYLTRIIKGPSYANLSEIQKGKLIRAQISKYKSYKAEQIKVEHYAEKIIRIDNYEDQAKYLIKLVAKKKLSEKLFRHVLGKIKKKGIKIKRDDLLVMYDHLR